MSRPIRTCMTRERLPRLGHQVAWAWLLIVAIGVMTPVQPIATAAPADASERDALAARQQLVHDRMTQLEDRMFRLIDQLAETEPEQAERLETSLRRARELLIRRNMDETIELLDRRALTDAADRQLAIIANLEAVLASLMEEPDRTKQRRSEIERLKAFSKDVRKLLDAQRDIEAQSGDKEALPTPLAQASKEQRTLGQQADELARRMQGQPAGGDEAASQPASSPADAPEPDSESSEADESESTPSTDGPPPPPAPGTEHVEQSGQRMAEAADQLDKRNASGANSDQREAINELEDALAELQRALDQLRREQQEEILRGLEARFRAMLTEQLAVNDGTTSLDAKEHASWTHADELTLAGLTHDQRGLAARAGEALHILEEEGTTIVFPQVVRQLQEDMAAVAGRLQSRHTGATTQQVQTAIVATLEELIEAMKQLRAELESGGGQSGSPGGGGGADQEPPLLPDSAELKMLRSCQLRVNRQTSTLGDEAAAADADPAAELRRWGDRQQELAEMARKMHDRVTGE